MKKMKRGFIKRETRKRDISISVVLSERRNLTIQAGGFENNNDDDD